MGKGIQGEKRGDFPKHVLSAKSNSKGETLLFLVITYVGSQKASKGGTLLLVELRMMRSDLRVRNGKEIQKRGEWSFTAMISWLHPSSRSACTPADRSTSAVRESLRSASQWGAPCNYVVPCRGSQS
jgi:hypothetical protein